MIFANSSQTRRVLPFPNSRCKNASLGNPKIKVALTYEPAAAGSIHSSLATDDNDNTLATVKDTARDDAQVLERLVPVLNKERGCFVLGGLDRADRMFQYGVKIVFGKNLHKALPADFRPPPNPKYQGGNSIDSGHFSLAAFRATIWGCFYAIFCSVEIGTELQK